MTNAKMSWADMLNTFVVLPISIINILCGSSTLLSVLTAVMCLGSTFIPYGRDRLSYGASLLRVRREKEMLFAAANDGQDGSVYRTRHGKGPS
jgi:hypothetical protein